MAEPEMSTLLNFGGPPRLNDSTPSHLTNEERTESNESLLIGDPLRETKRAKHDNKFQNHIINHMEKLKGDLEEMIYLVMAGLPLKYSYNTYYTNVESLCRFKHVEQSKLTLMLYLKIDESFIQVKSQISSILTEQSLQKCISQYLEVYEIWENKLILLSKLFLYLDRGYLLPHTTKKRIVEYGLNLFVDELLCDDKYAQLTLAKHKSLLQKYRELEENEGLSKRFSTVLIKLNYDAKIKLQNDLLALIIQHFDRLKYAWSASPSTYFHIVFKKMDQEIKYFKDCGLPSQLLHNLLLKLKWSLVFSDFTNTIQKCLPYLLENDIQLQVLFGFCKDSLDDFKVDTLSGLVYEWGQYILNDISKLLACHKAQPTKDIITILVDSYTNLKRIVDTTFQGEDKFEFELRSSFTKALNDKSFNSVIIFQLCKYCDWYFKNKKLDLSFHEFQKNVLIVFKSINNKHEFIIPYKRDLSKRLLMIKGTNFNQELALADEFLSVVGDSDDINSLQVMFHDLKASKDLCSLIPATSLIQFNPLILDKKHWPDIPKKDNNINLPNELKSILDEFSSQYYNLNGKFKNQNLDWSNYTLHQLTIMSHFKNGTKELVLNLLQATVIYLFNDQVSYTFKAILEATRIEEKLLRRVLLSFSSEKYKILLQVDDTFSYNADFTDKSSKIRIPLGKDKEVRSKQDAEAMSTIQKNRSDECRSVVMKIAKKAKELSLTDLLNESLEILVKRSPITIQDLKMAIEDLIDKEYIMRKDMDTIIYLP